MPTPNIYIYPNYAFQLSNKKLSLEASHELLIKPLLDNDFKVTLVGVLDESSVVGNYKVIFSNKVGFYFLSKFKKRKHGLFLLLNYFIVFLRCILVFRKSSLNYVFLPGNIGLIVTLLSLILKHPYAIYYRGDWEVKTPRVFRRLKNKIFQNAKFLIYVGAVSDNSIASLNNNVDTVIPMLSIPINLYKKDATFFNRKRFSILFIGEISIEKGVYELLTAFRNLHLKGFENFYLTIVGNGKNFEDLALLVDKFQLNNKVEMLGKITEPSVLINLFDSHSVFCLPSYSEGFPRVIYEAMMFAMPIITTNVGKINSLLSSNLNALFINTKDVDDLEAKIQLLFNNEELRISLGNNAINTIRPYVQKWQGLNHGDQFISWFKKVNY